MNTNQVPGVNKKPATGSCCNKAVKSTANFEFQSEAFGRRRAEFYSSQSYIRRWLESERKWTLLVACSGEGHHQKCANLVPHAKKEDVTKEGLLEVRAGM